MEVVYKEIHRYSSSNTFYIFDKNNQNEYYIMLLEGFLGDRWYTFVNGIDYELFNDGILFLPGGDKPEPPPSSLSSNDTITFEVSYIYDTPPIEAMKQMVYPFMKEEGVYMMIINALGAQIQRLYTTKNSFTKEHDLLTADGIELDYMGKWYDVTRMSDESDEYLRGRLLDFLDSYVSSGTIDTISAAVEAYTGTVPEITELWQSISYFNYNIDDYNDPALSPDQWRVYLFAGGSPDGVYTFQGYFYDPLFQLNMFFCILPYDVITTYGIENIKIVIQRSKAAGVQGYIGWLVNESFDDFNDWDVI